ncbi:MAG: hypothetical protein AB8B91_12475 [Rubripirellula sp.]
MLPCVALGLIIGCGGGGGEPTAVETTVSQEDQKVADDTAAEYDSDEYAKAMAAQNKK